MEGSLDSGDAPARVAGPKLQRRPGIVWKLPLVRCLLPPWARTMRLQQLLKNRAEELRKWLESRGHQCWTEQRHLKEGSAEQVYWHFGYFSAIQDVLTQLGKRSN